MPDEPKPREDPDATDAGYRDTLEEDAYEETLEDDPAPARDADEDD